MSADDDPRDRPDAEAAGTSGSTRSNLSGSAGDVVQARDVHGGVHFHGPTPAGRRPRQLPADVGGFVNRLTEVDLLDTILDTEGGPPEVGLFVIAGTAGVGKTSLAIHWAHRVHHRFPDGQLCVNLRGYDPGTPLTAETVLDRFLRALDVIPKAIPTDVDARAALYRTLLADRRALILLDNAATVGQVRPLLPGSSGCLVLVTSRNRLSGLGIRDGARRLTLDLLPESDAVDLLRTLTARYRASENPDTFAELARLCARLPLALRIAAERAASRPQMPLADLIRDLRDESALWEALTADDEDDVDAVRTVFAWSYRALPEPAAQMFRLIGLHPGPEFGTPAAAALAGLSTVEARHLLDVLVGAHLIEQTGPDRYQFHDLPRAYAIDQVIHQEASESRQMTTQRILTWYLHCANIAETRIGAVDLHIALDPPDSTLTLPTFETRRAAAGWLDQEQANLLAATRVAASDPDLRPLAWRLPAVLRTYYMRHNLFEDWFTATRLGLEAARALGDRHGQAELLDSLGLAHVAAHQLDAATRAHLAALAIRRELGDHLGEAVSLNALGLTYLHGRRLSDAHEQFTACVAAFGQLGDDIWRAVALANLGETLCELGQYPHALEFVGQALTVFHEAHDAQGEGNALRLLATIHCEQGDPERALPLAQQALAIAVEHGNRMWEGFWLLHLGATQLAAPQPDDALVSYQRAATIQRRLGDRNREARALNGAGLAYQQLDRPDQAVDFHRTAANALRELADPWHLALALDDLATALEAVGRADEARTHRQDAMSLLEAFADPITVARRAHLRANLNRNPSTPPA
jgi:tetratricopeptide (TPR) repeat protein